MSDTVTWEWLATCRNCKQVHEYRRHNPLDLMSGGTYSTTGCKTYQPRLGPRVLAQLREEQSVEQAARAERLGT